MYGLFYYKQKINSKRNKVSLKSMGPMYINLFPSEFRKLVKIAHDNNQIIKINNRELKMTSSFKEGDLVEITVDSAFKGRIGKLWNRGNGSTWQVEVCPGVGVYFFESEFKLANS